MVSTRSSLSSRRSRGCGISIHGIRIVNVSELDFPTSPGPFACGSSPEITSRMHPDVVMPAEATANRAKLRNLRRFLGFIVDIVTHGRNAASVLGMRVQPNFCQTR